MKFIVQYNLMGEESLQKVREAVSPFPHEFVGVIPFSHEITAESDLVGEKFIPYGSTLLTTLALDKRWEGLYFDLKRFSMYKASMYRNDMLNGGIFLSVREAESYLRRTFSDAVFIRPDLDLKHFSGQVMNSIECADWLKDAMSLPPESGSYAMSPEMLVQISTPQNIQAEYRYFVVGGKVVSGSMYRAHGQMRQERVIEPAILAEAQKFADGWKPHETCVMDLALCEGEVKVIEFNCINSSGFYDNDVDAVFAALWKYANKENNKKGIHERLFCSC